MSNLALHLLCVALIAAVAIIPNTLARYLWPTVRHFRRRLNAWYYLISGPSLIQAEYGKAEDAPFEVHAPDHRTLFVSSEKDIKDLDLAPDSVLSMQAATKHMLQPKYTMNGFNWFDERGTEGVGFIRALRTLLTNNLPALVPDICSMMSVEWEATLARHADEADGSKHMSIYPIILRLTSMSNARAFFGAELSQSKPFIEAAQRHVEETLKTAEAVRLLPKAIAPFVGRWLASRSSSHKVIYDALVPIAEQRLLERSLAARGHKIPQHASHAALQALSRSLADLAQKDCIQWIMETSPKKTPWPARRIVHELLAIWFGSVHAVSITATFALHDLCLHREYLKPLYAEATGAAFADFERTAQGLPLLDSFIKESARLTPVEAMSARRQALQPHTLASGHTLREGDWLCIAAHAMMRDARHYAEPAEFHGFRFAAAEIVAAAEELQSASLRQSTPSRFTDVGAAWHVWGVGRIVCPGRFYASMTIKMLLRTVLVRHDVRLVDSNARRNFTWRSSTLPCSGVKIAFRPRESSESW